MKRMANKKKFLMGRIILQIMISADGMLRGPHKVGKVIFK
jgi:hypothetical protein